MLDPTLQATLEERLGELALARTEIASPTHTIKPAPVSAASESRLPLISLAAADPARGLVAGAGSATTDLELRALLGEGGMGRVELAYQRSLEREVAVKTTREGASASAAAALVREARIAGTLEHPGIVPVHALGIDANGAPVLVMKRVEGVDWETMIRDPAHVSWAARPGARVVAHVEILMQVCRTVEFAHTRGVLHLDIKPENVMVGSFGEVYLVDWGIARRFEPRSREGLPYPTLAGTPAFMAPEMVTGATVDPRTDVYLLGATLHAALTGEPRNAGNGVAAVLTAAMLAAPWSYEPDVPTELAAICNRATARAPEERYASAEELRVALGAYLQHRSAIALADEARERSEALGELLAASSESPADLPRAYRLANEARFGFEQALRQWPENAAAEVERARAITRAVELELRQGHVEAAEALCADLGAVPPALRARMEEVRAVRARASKEQERLRAIAHDQDMSVGSRQRTIAIAVYSVASVIGSISIVLEGDALRPAHMLAVAVAIFVGSLAIIGALRTRLLVNAFNRRASALFVMGSVTMMMSRLIALVLGLSIARTVTLDLLVLWVVITSATVTLLTRLWPMAVVLLASCVVALLLPGVAVFVFGANVVLLPPALVLAFHLHARAAPRNDYSAPP
jgi:serine/threonine-protein kinase